MLRIDIFHTIGTPYRLLDCDGACAISDRLCLPIGCAIDTRARARPTGSLIATAHAPSATGFVSPSAAQSTRAAPQTPPAMAQRAAPPALDLASSSSSADSPLATPRSLGPRASLTPGLDSPNMRQRLWLAEMRAQVCSATASDSTTDNYNLAVKTMRAGNIAAACGALNSLAASLKEDGKLDLAITIINEVLELRKQEHSAKHLVVATSMQSLAAAHSEAGHFQEANALFIEAMEMIQELVGKDHLQMANALNNYAQSLMAQQNLSMASASLAEALAIRRKALGSDNATVAATLFQYSHCIKKMGDAKKAAAIGHEALSIYTKVLGPLHPTTEAARRESTLDNQHHHHLHLHSKKF